MFETQSFSCSSKASNEPPQDKNKWITTRQHSCAFGNIPSPCVNAIHHIQELELKMEKCFQQVHLWLKITKITKVGAESIEDTWCLLSTKLHFKEADVSCEDGKTLTLKQETEAALLLEVTELIKRLEADREETEKALELEKQQRKKLGMKIDCMSLWRLQQLPAAVQKEYETCVQDTLELQWHFDCYSHQLRQVQNQILDTERANRKIQEDIDFMKKHSPLLEEKLNLEGEAVKEVLLACEKVNTNTTKMFLSENSSLLEVPGPGLDFVHKDCGLYARGATHEHSVQAESRGMMLLAFHKCLEHIWNVILPLNELKHSEFIWTEYCMKLKETEEKIIKDEKHLEELVKQKAEIQEDAKCWNSKIEDLNNKIAAQGDESVKKSDASSEVIKPVEGLKSTRESDLQNIKDKLLNINEALDILKCKSEELQEETEELLQKFRSSLQKLPYLDQRAQELDKQQKQTEQQLQQKRSIMQQQLNETVVSNQIAENSHTMEHLKNELKGINELWNLKQTQIKNTEKSFIDLWKNLSGLAFKQQNAWMVFNHLQDELAEYEKRIKQEGKTHGELLQIRKKILEDSKAAREQIIKENLWLAQEYKIFQNYYLNSKEDLAEPYDHRLKVEAAIRGHQQRWLWLLPPQLWALAEWWSRHGLSIQPGLARIQAASQENAQKILAVQGEFSKAIQHITAFRSLTDGSPTTDNNANNQCVLDAETKDKKSHTVQITV
ncbi:LOW QUALITY PROTEIN: coiled-coil domain-containing protein 178 [Leptosomus discolor]